MDTTQLKELYVEVMRSSRDTLGDLEDRQREDRQRCNELKQELARMKQELSARQLEYSVLIGDLSQVKKEIAEWDRRIGLAAKFGRRHVSGWADPNAPPSPDADRDLTQAIDILKNGVNKEETNGD